MNRLSSDILIVGGGPAGMAAAIAAAENSGKSVTVVDDNPLLGGQIWKAALGKIKSPEAAKIIDAISNTAVKIINNAQVYAAVEPNLLVAETPDGALELEYKKLIIATGARERFLPFPGWTLPNVFGAGGLQALVKGGLKVENKRIVVAGTGPLLLAVAEFLKAKGAKVVAIAEQAPARKLNKFALGLWRTPGKIAQAAALRTKLIGVPYLTDCWVTEASDCGSPRVSKGLPADVRVKPLITRGLPQQEPASRTKLRAFTLTRKGKTWDLECDFLACGFHLVPNTELASILGCVIENGIVRVDDLQKTSRENIYCAGEPTGIGGIEASLIEGKIAGLAAAGEVEKARTFFTERRQARRFGDSLNQAFALRDELKTLPNTETLVCRCEDVEYGRLKDFDNFRDAKLQTRCGMGPCQGRICGAATEFLFGWAPGTVRPPIFPVKMENL